MVVSGGLPCSASGTSSNANGLQAGAYTVLLADLAASLRLSEGELALAALSGAGIPGVLASGRLSDRLGRRPVLVAGTVGVALFFLGLAVVDSYTRCLPP